MVTVTSDDKYSGSATVPIKSFSVKCGWIFECENGIDVTTRKAVL